MKISKLYIRNFITVMIIIIASQVCIAWLFRFVGGAAGSVNFESDMASLGYMINTTVSQLKAEQDRESIQEFIDGLSEVWSADIWFEKGSGEIIAASSDSARPAFPDSMVEFSSTESYRLYKNPGGPPLLLLHLKLNNGNSIFIKRSSSGPPPGDFHFSTGLLIITVIAAIVLLPISRRITNPLKKLTESANAISRGEFNLRVDESSTDEIGELARAFNVMSGRVLQMINGTKELTANISHQIRSPLARISVAAGIVRDRIDEGDRNAAEKNISTIEKEIEDIDSLTGRIIELLRVETSFSTADIQEINLQETASLMSEKYRAIFEKNEISYTSELTGIPCVIKGISRDINELFDILYDNAVKYTAAPGNISLEMHPEKEGVVMSLSNNTELPAGFDPEQIFEPFKRLAPEKISGNGLGLAIASRIVKNHGGEIKAEYSDPLFTVTVKFLNRKYYGDGHYI